MLSRRGTRHDVTHICARFVRDEHGATVVEYALICGVMAICVVGALIGVANPVNTIFTGIAKVMPAVE